MATVLPIISQPASKPLSSPHCNVPAIQSDKATNKSKQTSGPPVVVAHRVLNKKEQELEQRRMADRAKLPKLTEWQTDE